MVEHPSQRRNNQIEPSDWSASSEDDGPPATDDTQQVHRHESEHAVLNRYGRRRREDQRDVRLGEGHRREGHGRVDRAGRAQRGLDARERVAACEGRGRPDGRAAFCYCSPRGGGRGAGGELGDELGVLDACGGDVRDERGKEPSLRRRLSPHVFEYDGRGVTYLRRKRRGSATCWWTREDLTDLPAAAWLSRLPPKTLDGMKRRQRP